METGSQSVSYPTIEKKTTLLFPELLFWNDRSQECLSGTRGSHGGSCDRKEWGQYSAGRNVWKMQCPDHTARVPAPSFLNTAASPDMPFEQTWKANKYQPGRHANKTYDWALIALMIQVLWFKIIKNRTNNSVWKKEKTMSRQFTEDEIQMANTCFSSIFNEMKFICAFYISKFSTKRKHDYNSGGKTLKILKYKIKFKNVNLVSASWMNGWAGPLCLENSEHFWRTVDGEGHLKGDSRPQGVATASGAEVDQWRHCFLPETTVIAWQRHGTEEE